MNVTKTLTHRDSLGYWLNEAGLTGKGAEIGCAFGLFSSRILSTWKGATLYMVDPWERQDPAEYRENQAQMNFPDWYARCQALAAQDPRAVLVKKLSKDAAPDMADLSLDFVYIDGNHDYRHVLEDVDIWYPKIRVGGLIGGHDFYSQSENGAFCQVDTAVRRWMFEHSLPFTVTPCTSWWVIKQ